MMVLNLDPEKPLQLNLKLHPVPLTRNRKILFHCPPALYSLSYDPESFHKNFSLGPIGFE